MEENRKKKIVALMKEPSYVPMKEKELACLMQVQAEERAELKRLLQELLLEGKIQVNRRGRYSVPSVPPVIGTFIGHQKGFGFVEVEGRREDLFVPAAKTNGACHQDTVEVRLLGGYPGGRQEAEVVRILASGKTDIGEEPWILTFRRAGSVWMKRAVRWRLFPMREIRRPG